MHEPEEVAEHAVHGGHNPFDRRVAMTMVVVAAVLAGVKVLGHRSHNDTLRHQIEAGVLHTQESDQWAYFQAKKQRQYLFEAEAALLAVLPRESGDGPRPAPTRLRSSPIGKNRPGGTRRRRRTLRKRPTH